MHTQALNLPMSEDQCLRGSTLKVQLLVPFLIHWLKYLSWSKPWWYLSRGWKGIHDGLGAMIFPEPEVIPRMENHLFLPKVIPVK